MNQEREAILERALRQALCGESEGFAEIVREYQAMVFSIGRHYLGDRAMAEDLAQEVFLKLYRGLGGIKSTAHLKYWLRQVAVNRAIDYGRAKKIRPDVPLEEVPEPEADDSSADWFLWERLRLALTALLEKQRMMLVLRYQEDLTPAEIAKLLNVSENTVKSTLQRGLEDLRRKLAKKLKEARYAFF